MSEVPNSTPEPTEEPKQEFYTVTPEDMLKNVQSLAKLVVQYSDKMHYWGDGRCRFKILEEVSADVISPLVGLGTTNSAIRVSEDLDVRKMDDFIEFFFYPYCLYGVTITGITFEVLDSNINGSFVYRPETDAVVTIACEAKYYGTGSNLSAYNSGSHQFKIDFVVNRSDPTDWLIYNIDLDCYYDGIIKEQLRNEDGSISQVGTQIDGGDFCGLNWVVTDANTLIISGHLEDANAYEEVPYKERPWYTYHKTITQACLTCTGMQSMAGMFSGFSSLTVVDLRSFDTSNVTDMSNMFRDCFSLTSLDLSNFDTSSVTDMSNMFCMRMMYGYSSLTSLDVSGFDTSSVTDMSGMFSGCSSLTSLDVSNFDTSNVTDMGSMFLYCHSLTGLDVSNFDTRNVTDIAGMFEGCSSLTSLDVSGFDTSSVTDMSNMFRGCSSLTSLDVSDFDTSNVTVMSSMFSDCSRLTSLDVSSFDTSNVTNMWYMFYDCSRLQEILVGNDWLLAPEYENMFLDCGVDRVTYK